MKSEQSWQKADSVFWLKVGQRQSGTKPQDGLCLCRRTPIAAMKKQRRQQAKRRAARFRPPHQNADCVPFRRTMNGEHQEPTKCRRKRLQHLVESVSTANQGEGPAWAQ